MTVNWKKSLIVLCDVVIAGYLVMAVTAFNKPDAAATHCTEVKTDIEQNIVDGFLTADEISKMLRQEKVYPLSLPMQDINARQIEETLQKSPFVERAECYKTQSGHVCIQVRQRVPVVKVMADNGENYYIDSHANVMPENRYVNDLIVATGHISRKYAQSHLSRADQCAARPDGGTGAAGWRPHYLYWFAQWCRQETGAYAQVLSLWSEQGRMEQILIHQCRIRQSDYLQESKKVKKGKVIIKFKV